MVYYKDWNWIEKKKNSLLIEEQNNVFDEEHMTRSERSIQKGYESKKKNDWHSQR